MRIGQANPLVHDRLHRPKHDLLLALGESHPPGLSTGALEDRLHQESGAEDELLEPLAVSGHVGDRSRRHARFHRRLGDRRREMGEKPRIEGARDDVIRAEGRRLAGVGRSQVAGLDARQLGDRAHTGELHRLVDGGGPHIECAAEDVGEAQRIVDLVGIVRAAGSDDRIRAHRFRLLGHDLGHGVGEREDDRLLGHARHHLRLEHASRRQPQKNVGTLDRLGQGALAKRARVTPFFAVQIVAVGVDHTFAIEGDHVGRIQPERDQHVQAGDARRPGAGGHELDLADFLAHQQQGIEHGRPDDDRGAVLVVVEHRNLEPLPQFSLRCRSTPAP